jgi:hypothetical protein
VGKAAAFGGLLEGRRWAVYMEGARLVLGAVALLVWLKS